MQHNTFDSVHGDIRNLHSNDPAHNVEVILEEEVIGFVIKAPLLDDQTGTAVFHLSHYIDKVFLFPMRQLVLECRK